MCLFEILIVSHVQKAAFLTAYFIENGLPTP